MAVERIDGDEDICVFSLNGTQRSKVFEKIQDELCWWDQGCDELL
jgi:hypothetical protein